MTKKAMKTRPNANHVIGLALAVFSVWGGVSCSAVAQTAASPELLIQDGHSNAVNSIVFSPDGRMLASGAADNSVKLWDLRVGRLMRSFEGHIAGVNSVAFSPDGRTISSASDDKTIKLWDALTGQLIRTIEGHTDKVNSVAFSPNGRMLASGSADSWVNLWDPNSGRLIRQLEGVAYDALSVAFSPDGSLLAAACKNQSVRLWDMRTGNLISDNLPDSDRPPSGGAISFSPNSRVVALGSAEEDSISFLNCQTGQQTKFDGFSKGILSVAFSPDGKVIASGGEDHSVRLFSTNSGGMSASFEEHTAPVGTVAFSADGRMLASGGNDSSIKIRDVSSGKLIYNLGTKSFGVYSVAVSPDGKTIASASGATVKLWDALTGRLLRALEGNQGLIMSVAFSPDGQFLAAGNREDRSSPSRDENNGVHVWNVSSGKLIKTLKGHANWTKAIAFSSDSKQVISAGTYSEPNVSDIASGQLVLPQVRRAISASDMGILTLAVSPDGKTIAAGNENKTIRLFDTTSLALMRTLKGHGDKIFSLVYSPDGRTLASASRDRTLKLWDAESGRLIRSFEGHTDSVSAGAFSPDGRTVASGSADQTIKLWDVATGSLIRTLQGHTHYVVSLAFNPNGRTLVSGSSDKTAKVWSVENGKLLASLMAFNDGNWIAYTPDGYYNGSDEAAKHVTWRVGATVFDFDQFFDKFFRPDVIHQVLEGARVENTGNVAQGFALPPEVIITSPRPGQTLKNSEIEVTVEARDLGGGINGVTLYQNGKAVSAAQRAILLEPASSKTYTATFRVSLLDGTNTLKATAFSKDRTESRPYEVSVTLVAPAKEVSLHLLVVGINRYQNSALNLNFAGPDADGIVAYFRQNGARLFRDVNIVQLRDAEATKSNILAAFLKIREKAQPQDVVIFYFAGHGDNRGDQWYFIPHDMTRPESDEEVAAKGVSSSTISDEVVRIKAQKALLLVDACKSGSLLAAFRGYEDRKVMAQLARAAGIHVIAASTKDQVASEVKELGHGVFTYLLLKGLGGEAVTKASDRSVTVRGLLAYIEAQLPEISMKYKTRAQYPVSSSTGMDFPLSVVK